MSLEQLYLVLLAGGLTLLVGVAAVRLAGRFGLPALLAFLALGVLLGESVLGVSFENAQLAQNLGMIALALILIDGGLTTRWTDIRSLVLPAGVLATVGVAISTGVIAVGGHYLLGMEWRTALLLGAIVSSTDAAAVFSVLRHLPLPSRVAGLLEAESGFNDAPTVILVLLLSVAVPAGPVTVLGDLVFELVVGALIGIGIGWVGAQAARRIALPAAGLYPLLSVGLGMVAFAAAGSIHASGFIAAYVASVLLGNSPLPHRAATRSFAEGAAWLAQIGLFVMLGLLVSPERLPGVIVPALIIGAVMFLIARPASVAISLLPFRFSWREQAVVAWAGLRGAVPIVLATIPVVNEVPGAWYLLDIVFVLVVVFTLIQGPTLTPLVHKLRLADPERTRDVEIEAAPLDVIGASLMTVTIPDSSKLHGLYIFELRLPETSVINSIVRRGRLFVPGPNDRLHIGDELLIITLTGTRAATEARLRALGREGKLAKWHGEHGH